MHFLVVNAHILAAFEAEECVLVISFDFTWIWLACSDDTVVVECDTIYAIQIEHCCPMYAEGVVFYEQVAVIETAVVVLTVDARAGFDGA